MGLIPYLVIGAVILAAFGGTYYQGRQAGKEVMREELQPKLTACEGREVALGQQIDAQNKAVAALKAEGDARMSRAAKGLEAERKIAASAKNEADRLRAMSKNPALGSNCPAGQAVQEIRKGLR